MGMTREQQEEDARKGDELLSEGVEIVTRALAHLDGTAVMSEAERIRARSWHDRLRQHLGMQ